MERWNTYTFGRHVIIEGDHKPLVSIVKKCLAASPKRVQRMLLRLRRFDFELRYRPGRELTIPDSLSRAFPSTTKETVFTEEIALLQTIDAEQTADIQTIASPATLKLITDASDDPNYRRLR